MLLRSFGIRYTHPAPVMIENGEWKQMSYRVYVGIFSFWRERGAGQRSFEAGTRWKSACVAQAR
ncbi:hypothetical protein LMG19089_01688 [Ralstonia edaphis]|uniref:Uncharacterized protein n=1 Tax=Ralstonia edaphi TaxID=3058599 RepID=A0AB72X7H9_9RALS|nr:hypothetical protein LMG19089_01688 [Ralstonia sp. LMG 6871]CAJ0741913.1 hypothetical protein R16034_02882 [Ralstonia sp. LMG 6871]